MRIFPITSWSDFKKLFREHFFSINAVTYTVDKLEETIYYQDSHTLEKYLDKFQILNSEQISVW